MTKLEWSNKVSNKVNEYIKCNITITAAKKKKKIILILVVIYFRLKKL